jgi:hypothetical protein
VLYLTCKAEFIISKDCLVSFPVSFRRSGGTCFGFGLLSFLYENYSLIHNQKIIRGLHISIGRNMMSLQRKYICFGLFDFCKACKDVFQAYIQGSIVVGIVHHDSQPSLIQAASDRCYICSIVIARLESRLGKAATWLNTPEITSLSSIYSDSSSDPMIKLEVCPFRSGARLDDAIKFRLIPRSGKSSRYSVFENVFIGSVSVVIVNGGG